MKPTTITLTTLLTLASCGGDTPHRREALAIAEAIRAARIANGGGGDDLREFEAMLAPPPAPAGPDLAAVDVGALVTDAELVAMLRKRRCGGDGTDTATFRIGRQPKVLDRFALDGRSCPAVEFTWTASWPDQGVGAQGSFTLVVIPRATYEFYARVEGKPIAGLGDEAVMTPGVPYVRAGELAATVTQNSGTAELAVEVLRLAAPRLKR